MSLRNRIKGHRRVKASELVPHELNPRLHSDTQRQALRELVGEVGYARSVLTYVSDKDMAEARALAARLAEQGERPDDAQAQALHRAPLTLIDGHLRQSEFPDEVLEVEVLDVDDAEARKLLLSIDPLAQLADYDAQALEKLRATAATDSETVQALWDSLTANESAVKKALGGAKGKGGPEGPPVPEQFLVVVECADEQGQVALLRRFKREGLKCKAVTN